MFVSYDCIASLYWSSSFGFYLDTSLSCLQHGTLAMVFVQTVSYEGFVDLGLLLISCIGGLVLDLILHFCCLGGFGFWIFFFLEDLSRNLR